MQISFENKSVLITGGSRGIGLATALGFARAGARVAICARDQGGLDAAVVQIAQSGNKVHGAICDVGDEGSITGFVADAAAVLGGIDILVNNASGMSDGEDESAWLKGINVDLLGTVRTTRSAVPLLAGSGSGAIVNISSIRGMTGSKRLPALSLIHI